MRRVFPSIQVFEQGHTVNLVIRSVDHAPDDLDRQLPIRGRLVRMLEGTDTRGRNYWLVDLSRPISWNLDGVTRTIRHLLIAARWVGTSIQPGAKIPVNINYVTNDALLSSEQLQLAHGIRRDRHGEDFASVVGSPVLAATLIGPIRRRNRSAAAHL